MKLGSVHRASLGFALLLVVGTVIYAVIYYRPWLPLRYGAATVPTIDLVSAETALAKTVQAALAGVEAHPYSADVWGQLATILDVHDLRTEAIECYTRAATLDPSDYRWPYCLAVCQRLTDQEAAVQSLQRAAELEPGYAPIHAYLGDGLLKLGQIDGAEAAFTRLITLDATHLHGQLGLAKVALARDGLAKHGLARSLAEDALPHLRAVIAKQPTCGEAHRLLATVYQRLDDSAAARTHAEYATWYPGPLALEDPLREQHRWTEGVTLQWRRLRARRHVSQRKLGLVLSEWKAGIELDPDSIELQLELALAHATSRDSGPAHAALERARSLDPNDPRIALKHGQVLVCLGQAEPAVEQFRLALAENSELHEARSQLGAILIGLGREDEGLEELSHAADRQPHDADAQFTTAMAYLRARRMQLAERYLARTIAAAPGNLRARFEHGVLLAKRGEALPAAAEFERVAALEPARAAVHLNLGKALHDCGEDVKAREAYRHGLEHVPGDRRLTLSLAWLLCTSTADDVRDGTNARRLATTLCEATNFADPIALRTLAAACAETGDYDAAIENADKALLCAESDRQRQLLERDVALYRARQPVRE